MRGVACSLPMARSTAPQPAPGGSSASTLRLTPLRCWAQSWREGTNTLRAACSLPMTRSTAPHPAPGGSFASTLEVASARRRGSARQSTGRAQERHRQSIGRPQLGHMSLACRAVDHDLSCDTLVSDDDDDNDDGHDDDDDDDPQPFGHSLFGQVTLAQVVQNA